MGEQVRALVTNRQPNQLVQRTQYLKDLLDSITAGKAIYIRDANLDPSVMVGHAVFWDVGSLSYKKALAGAIFDDAVEVVFV